MIVIVDSNRKSTSFFEKIVETGTSTSTYSYEYSYKYSCASARTRGTGVFCL